MRKLWLAGLFCVTQAALMLLVPLSAQAQGSSVVVPEYQFYVDGRQVISATEPVAATSRRPLFFGYVQTGVIVSLYIDGQQTGRTQSGNDGYWRIGTAENLMPGEHIVAMQLTDIQNISDNQSDVARITVPDKDVTPSYGIGIPNVALTELNYVTVSLGVIAVTAMSAGVYLLTKKRLKHEVEQ